MIMGAQLSVGVVCHDTEPQTLEKCMSSLLLELDNAISEDVITSATVCVLDNSERAEYGSELRTLINRQFLPEAVRLEVFVSRNRGFGAGHNELIARTSADIHLIVNPDLEFLPQSVAKAVKGIKPGVIGIVLPKILNSVGVPLRPHFRVFSPGYIFLRSVAPGFIKRKFEELLSAGAYQNDRIYVPAESSSVFSGCCMLFERSVLEEVGGFDERYFLYFEDYDLSLRALMKTSALIEPNFQVVHHGGNTSQKGRKHIYRFLVSAIRFYWGRIKLALESGKEVC